MPDSSQIPSIKPGFNVDIVVDLDWGRESIDVRRATVYDIAKDQILLSQTTPPLRQSFLGKRLQITYIARGDRGPERYGVMARVKEFLKNYRLSEEVSVPALSAHMEDGYQEINLRMYYRIEPTSASGIYLSLWKEQLSLIDISIGGAKFSYKKITGSPPRERSLKAGEIHKFRLDLDREAFDIDAKVIRTIKVEGRMEKELEIAAIQFVSPKKKIKEILARKIRSLERDFRYREVFPRDTPGH